MLNRVFIKDRAKSMFTAHYWPCVGIFLLLTLLGSGVAGFSGRFSSTDANDYYSRLPDSVKVVISSVAVILGIIAFMYVIFVMLPSRVSGAKTGMNIYDGEEPKVSDVFWAFRDGRYWKSLGTMLLRSLVGLAPIIVIWILAFAVIIIAAVGGLTYSEFSEEITPVYLAIGVLALIMFLLAIPAAVFSIVLSCGFSQTEYVAADMGIWGKDALKKSWQLMRGRKWEYFVFGLSFFGWTILTALTIGILGVFYTGPYMGISYAGFYRELGCRKDPEEIKEVL